MKMAMISYNEAIDSDVMEVLEKCGFKSYTKIPTVYGKGESSGTHLGNDIWPGRNNILFAADNDAGIKKLLSCIRELRKKLGQEGVKAFVWNLEEVT